MPISGTTSTGPDGTKDKRWAPSNIKFVNIPNSRSRTTLQIRFASVAWEWVTLQCWRVVLCFRYGSDVRRVALLVTYSVGKRPVFEGRRRNRRSPAGAERWWTVRLRPAAVSVSGGHDRLSVGAGNGRSHGEGVFRDYSRHGNAQVDNARGIGRNVVCRRVASPRWPTQHS
jgi:hypothetical protein